MREILVDHARKRATIKRGGGQKRVEIRSDLLDQAVSLDVLCLIEAIEALEVMNRRQAQVVELRFFGGMTIEETAQFLGNSDSTVEADWRFARAWLSVQLSSALR